MHAIENQTCTSEGQLLAVRAVEASDLLAVCAAPVLPALLPRHDSCLLRRPVRATRKVPVRTCTFFRSTSELGVLATESVIDEIRAQLSECNHERLLS